MQDDHMLQERRHTLARILAWIETQKNAAPAPLLIGINDLQQANADGVSDRVVWTLLYNGIDHINKGGIDGAPGTMAAALACASIRNAPLAAALGITPPKFEPILFSVQYTDGFEEAIYLSIKLAELGVHDLSTSRRIIAEGLHAPPKMPVNMSDNHDEIRRQAILSFHALCDSYHRLCRQFATEIGGLNR